MAATNVTGDGKHNSYDEMFCSAELTGGKHNQLMYLTVVNIFLSITAILGNSLILVALSRESSLHPSSKLLFRNLATTDLCVGIIVEPLVVTSLMSAMNEQWHICRYTFVVAFIGSYILESVSLFSLTAISLDRLLVLLSGFRYRHAVTLKRMRLALTVFWVVSIFGTVMYFWSSLVAFGYGYAVVSVCLVTSILCYTRIFLTLHNHQIQVGANVSHSKLSQTTSMNRVRYRKTVLAAMWVQLALVVCYLPYATVETLIFKKGFSWLSSLTYLARSFAVTLVYLNSSLNPILLCWKIREVRRAVKEVVRELCR